MPADVEALRQSSQFRLLSLFSSIGPAGIIKDLVIHEDLMKPVDQVAGARLLRENGIEKMFKLTSSAPPWKNTIRIYFIPAIYSVAENVALQLKSDKSGTSQYHVVVMPKVFSLIQHLFESFGVMDFTTLHCYSWDFIPFDTNLISLEYQQFFKACFVKGDGSLLGSVAKALMSFECLFGNFLCVTTLGKKSNQVVTLLETWRKEVQPAFPKESQFTHLIMMDRTVDMASLLLTQLTYEGVLDENFTVQSGFVSLNTEEPGNEGSKHRLMLNSTKDKIYAEIKGKHISAVFQQLSGKAKELQKLRDKKDTASIEEMKQFVAYELKQIQTQQKLLAMHISACESVMKKQAGLLEELLNLQQDVMIDTNMKEYVTYLEDSMARQYDITSTTRLLCLYSVMHDGLAEKEFKTITKQFLQAYGYHHLSSLHLLERVGLFTIRDSKFNVEPLLPIARSVNSVIPLKSSEKTSFRKICRKLNLVVDQSPSADSSKSGLDPNYVYGGLYTPLVYKLVHNCLKEKEPSLEDFARCYGNDLRTNSYNNPNWNKPGDVLVVFLGGVTLAEAAALDLLSKQLGRTIVAAGTSTISGISLMKSIYTPDDA